MEDLAHLLGAVVGDFDTDMRLICREGLTESVLLTLREPITRGTQKKPDLIEGIACAPAVTGRVLLDAAACLIESVPGECDDVKGVEHAGSVLELVINGVLAVPGRDPASDSHPRTEVFAALGQPVLMHGARPARHQVHSSGPWDVPSREWSTMPVSSRAPAASVLVVPHASHRPWVREPLRSGRGHQMWLCRRGLIWDHTVFHVVASCRARPAMVAPSKRNCRIAQRIARTPKRAQGAHIRSSCSRNVTVWQVVSLHIDRRLNHRNLPGTPAQGASITSTTTRPRP